MSVWDLRTAALGCPGARPLVMDFPPEKATKPLLAVKNDAIDGAAVLVP
jgi:hypothetical protein